MEEIEQGLETQQNSDVSSESSSGSQDSGSAPAEASATAATQSTDSSANTPFHEHPRFKELVEQKNQAQQQQKAYEQRIAQMEAKFAQMQTASKGPDERAELLKRLEGIDPAFGKLISELSASPKELQELKAWKQQFEETQLRTQAVSAVNALHEQNKVDPELKELINETLVAMDAQGKINGINDVPRAYKEVHEKLNKYVENIKRGATASYVKDKTVDSKVPTSQPKGAPAKTQGNKFAFNTRDREAGLAQVVSQYIKNKSPSNDL